jgi:hypothetical protein
MTTLIPVTLNNTISPPFSAIFTLDGVAYSGAMVWNISAQRYYFQLTDQSGNVIWNGALIGSPLGTDIPLAPGIFTTSTIVFREDTGNFEVNP